MKRSLVLMVALTFAVIQVNAMYISWYPEYSEVKSALGRKPSNYYKPYSYKPRPPKIPKAYNYGSYMPEDNDLCAKFKCDKRACCSGECVNVFGMQMCLVVSNRYGYGKR